MRQDLAIAAYEPVARNLGLSVQEVAQSVIDIAVSGMYADVSGLVSRFGIDVREYSLLAFGGAGPMLSCFLARELKCKNVIVPQAPGVLSALGGLVADIKNDFIQVVFKNLNSNLADELKDGYAQLETAATNWLRGEQNYKDAYHLRYVADMRYVGQSYEIEVELEADWVKQKNIQASGVAFHRQHESLYEHSDETAQIQIITIRLVIAAPTITPFIKEEPPATEPLTPSYKVNCYADREWREASVYLRSQIRPGHSFDGPAVVAQDDTTVCIPSDFRVTADAFRNLVISPISKRSKR